ncbi:MAG: hypothetical protein AAB560_02085 [Patescibacteria group bacterium]
MGKDKGVVNRPPLLFAFQTPAAPAAQGPLPIGESLGNWERIFLLLLFTAALLAAVKPLPKVLPIMEAQKASSNALQSASQRSKNREIVPYFFGHFFSFQKKGYVKEPMSILNNK